MLAYMPSPPQGVWYPGPLPICAYAIYIIIGILVATWWTRRRWVTRGGQGDDILEVVVWAVPFGIIGGHRFHGHHRLGAVFRTRASAHPRSLPLRWRSRHLESRGPGCRRRVDRLPTPTHRLTNFVDAAGLVLVQAIGRLGNYFNQELYGAPTSLPLGIAHRPGRSAGRHSRHRPASAHIPVRISCGILPSP